MKEVKIYTDGSCLKNPGIGGWAALIKYKKVEKILKGSKEETTNNQMELIAVIKGLELLKESCKVIIITDSKYVKDGISKWIINWKKNNWKTANKKPVKNQVLWLELDNLVQKHKVEWEWVKGHNNHTENEIVDNLANLEAKILKKKINKV